MCVVPRVSSLQTAPESRSGGGLPKMLLANGVAHDVLDQLTVILDRRGGPRALLVHPPTLRAPRGGSTRAKTRGRMTQNTQRAGLPAMVRDQANGPGGQSPGVENANNHAGTPPIVTRESP